MLLLKEIRKKQNVSCNIRLGDSKKTNFGKYNTSQKCIKYFIAYPRSFRNFKDGRGCLVQLYSVHFSDDPFKLHRCNHPHPTISITYTIHKHSNM